MSQFSEFLKSAIKRHLLNPNLLRPDWIQNNPRNPDLLWLDKNENLDQDLLLITNQILKNLDPVAIATYPDSGPLYRKLSKHLNISPDSLRLTPGSDGGIRIVFEAFVSPGDKVLYPSPTFAMYSVYSKMFGAEPIEFSYTYSLNGPIFHFDDFCKTVLKESPKLVCLPNPDSPTGTIVQSNQIRHLLETCQKVGAILLIDEAYHPFSSISAMGFLNEFPNLVIVRTFAKAWAIAGLRIGYMMANPELTHIFHKLRPMYEVNTVSIFVLDQLIDQYSEITKSVARLKQGGDYFVAEMNRLGFFCPQTHGNFMHVRFDNKLESVSRALANKVLYRKSFAEPCLAGYSRFSLTTQDKFRTVVKLISSAVT